MANFYSLEKDTLSSHVPSGSSASEIFYLLQSIGALKMLPEFAKALKILATSCSTERSFSSLRRLKTYLRNSMGQERLSNLALLHVEREYVNKVLKEDMDKIIDTFGKRS